MAINSRSKGKAGELEFAHWLTDYFGIQCRRGQQFKGGYDSPDVCGIQGLHFEVKRVQNFNAYKAMEQAMNECEHNTPIVAHRKNHKDWLLVIQAKDLKKLANVIYSLSLAEGTSLTPDQDSSRSTDFESNKNSAADRPLSSVCNMPHLSASTLRKKD